MNTKSYIFAGIIAAITMGNAYATGENIIASKSYVDAQDALKQNLIDTDMVSISDGKSTFNLPALVSYDDTDNLTGTKYGILSSMGEYGVAETNNVSTLTIPTAGLAYSIADSVASTRQMMIRESGWAQRGQTIFSFNTNASNDSNSWLNASVAGTGLVTKTSTAGVVGERKIFEASDVSGYHDTNLTQNEKDIQDISIPTVGAMMSAISSGVSAAAPTGTANTIANYDSTGALGSGIATYTGAAAYNATNDSAKIPTMAGVATYAQAKMTCAGWPDGVEHTDANCWLWNKN